MLENKGQDYDDFVALDGIGEKMVKSIEDGNDLVFSQSSGDFNSDHDFEKIQKKIHEVTQRNSNVNTEREHSSQTGLT